MAGFHIDPLLNASDVIRILKVSRSTLDRMLAAGGFPRPDLVIRRRLKWKPATVQSYIDNNFKPGEGRTN